MKKQKGITLIALIITIIVILILVAVSVRTISKSGLFDHAKDATNKWANEQNKEANIGEGIGNIVEQYTPINPSKPTNPEYFTYIVDEETKTATLTGVKEEYAISASYYDRLYTNAIKDGDKIITNVILPSEVVINGIKYQITALGDNCFRGTESQFESFVIPNGINAIGNYAFYNCKKLEDVTMSSSVINIGDKAFSNCTSLKDIILPNSIINIGIFAFYGCSNITNIVISEGVTRIGESSFDNCNKLENIYVSEKNSSYLDENGILFNKSKTELIKCPEGKRLLSYEIPNGVETIKKYALIRQKELTNIEIPQTVKYIEDYAFSNCEKLTKVTIPEGVIDIGEGAFYNCYNVKEITIPSTVTSIGDLAFYFLYNRTRNIVINKPEGSIPGEPWGAGGSAEKIIWNNT